MRLSAAGLLQKEIAMYRNMINRCQPGYGASCSLCCGCYNYKLSQEQLEDMFVKRAMETPERPLKHPEESFSEKLYQDDMQCVHVGLRHGVLGCLVYNETDRGEEFESFYNGTGKNFFCPAWANLTDEQVVFAAQLMADWYYYGLFINDIEAVHELYAVYGHPEHVPGDELEELKEELWQRFLDEDGK